MTISNEHSYLDNIEEFITRHAPYQQALLIFDLSAPSGIIDDVSNRISKKCLLTKYLLRDKDSDDTLAKMLSQHCFRAAVVLSSKEQTFCTHNLFLPTTLDYIYEDDKVNLLICPHIISGNENYLGQKCLAYIDVELIEVMFKALIENDNAEATKVAELINNVNHFLTISPCLDNEKLSENYFQLVNKINLTISPKRIDIDKINIKKYDLNDFLVIFNIFSYTFFASENNYSYFDVYKCAKKFVPYSKKYFHFIEYFYELCTDIKIKYILAHYKQQLSSIIVSIVKAIKSLSLFSYVQRPTRGLELARQLVSCDIENDDKTFLACAKLYNIF